MGGLGQRTKSYPERGLPAALLNSLRWCYGGNSQTHRRPPRTPRVAGRGLGCTVIVHTMIKADQVTPTMLRMLWKPLRFGCFFLEGRSASWRVIGQF